MRSCGAEVGAWYVKALCNSIRGRNCSPRSSPPSAFSESLQRQGWDVHSQLDDPIGPPLENYPDGIEKEAELKRRLQELNDSLPKRALILKTSHIGGHKYAGNVIVRLISLEDSALYAKRRDALYRFTCPKARAYGMAVYPPTRLSPS
jgi:hypothetical protein